MKDKITPSSAGAQAASEPSHLPETVYGIKSMGGDFLVWVGSDKQQALERADFSRKIIEYRRIDVQPTTPAPVPASGGSPLVDERDETIARLKDSLRWAMRYRSVQAGEPEGEDHWQEANALLDPVQAHE